eukprot:CAMPEP_0182439174 /NCGR_PEP_ID=MMETSP1167-20130531/86276_1 /TAXON_ID=2988 /ORGANISM="Mallomonas Sp, Strain CCMP3275" /LENGTH=405 /DNA_ID=CAMNT_0024632815 /DNA_START=138 /DNA_END=1356 /DNA_ORIENTATION=-
MAKKHRDYHQTQTQLALAVRKDRVEVRSDLIKPNVEVEVSIKKKSRQSIASRLDTWRRHHEHERERRKARQLEVHLEVEERKKDQEDVIKYNTNEREREREDVCFRLDEWRRMKRYEEQGEKEREEAASYEIELRAQESKDVMEYQKQLEKSKRESLVYHADKYRAEKEREEKMKLLEQERVNEDKAMEASDREALREYSERERERKRESLAFRNEQETAYRVASQEREREREKERKSGFSYEQETAYRVASQASFLSESLSSAQCNEKYYQADKRALEDAKSQEREREREILVWTLVDHRKNHEESLRKHRELLDRLHDDFEARKIDYMSLKEEKEVRRERGRKSIVIRVESWKRERLLSEKLKMKERLQDQNTLLLRAIDIESMKAAKHREKMNEEVLLNIFV